MLNAEMTEGFGHSCATEMLDLPVPPTAFLVSSIISAIGVRRALEDRDLKNGARCINRDPR